MTFKSEMTDRLMAAVNIIPRQAQQIAIVGPDSSAGKEAFLSFSPAAQVSSFMDLMAFAAHLLEDDAVQFDAVLLLALTPVEGLMQRLSEHLTLRLTEDAVLVLEIANPFSASRLNRNDPQSKEIREADLTRLSERADLFTRNARAEVQKGNFILDRIDRIVDREFSKFLADMNDRLSLQDDAKTLLQRISSASHFHFRLTKRPARKIYIQGKVLKPVGGVNDVRMHEPLIALQSLPGVRVQVSEDQSVSNRQEPGLEKIFIWQRPILTFKSSLQILLALRRAGYLIIVDFDDHPSPWPKISENNYLSFAGVHAVQTTNEALARLIRRHNPEVGVFPNQLNRFLPRDLDDPKGPVKIFYGALNREQDYRDVLPALNSVLAELTQPFEFVVLHDRPFFDALKTPHKKFYGLGGYHQYLQILQTCHISLMPLAEGEFNRMKSDLKLIESAGAGAVPLASPVVYADTDQPGEFTEICQNASDFAAGLVRLVNDADYRRGKQQRGRAYVAEGRMLSAHFEDRYKWYLDLLNRQSELDQELGRRLSQIVPR